MTAATVTRNLPPDRRGGPWPGNLLAYSRDPLGFLTRCSRSSRDSIGRPGPSAVRLVLADPGRPPVPQPSITLRPRDGIKIRLRERQP